jgi:hypothetical protein
MVLNRKEKDRICAFFFLSRSALSLLFAHSRSFINAIQIK